MCNKSSALDRSFVLTKQNKASRHNFLHSFLVRNLAINSNNKMKDLFFKYQQNDLNLDLNANLNLNVQSNISVLYRYPWRLNYEVLAQAT
jgi:hypothetical protein